jgi:O-antigen biosynthesis protein
MRFVTVIGAYRNNSAGIRVMYKLKDDLSSIGYESIVYEEGIDVNDGNTIVIYPESVQWNPLKANNVVRYVLQNPHYWGQEQTVYDDSEYVITYKKDYYPDVPVLYIDVIDPKIFYEDFHQEKDIISIYVGKGHPTIYKENPKRDKMRPMVLITRSWPETREELGEILRRTYILYTYDNCSMITDEAIQCGAKVFYVSENGLFNKELTPSFMFNETSNIKEFAKNAIEFFNRKAVAA